jgi:anti-sigma28 factor (negative regulator of flagellin synthesis)
MKVNNRDLTGATPTEPGWVQETQKPNRNQEARAGTAATDKTGDRVELSSTLEAIARGMSAFGSARATHVQALTGEYRSGSHHPDSEATARGMVSEALLAAGR